MGAFITDLHPCATSTRMVAGALQSLGATPAHVGDGGDDRGVSILPEATQDQEVLTEIAAALSRRFERPVIAFLVQTATSSSTGSSIRGPRWISTTPFPTTSTANSTPRLRVARN